MTDLDDISKVQIIKSVLLQAPLVIKNDFVDAEQIVYNISTKQIILENWSPRENITYSSTELTIDQAWNYLEQHARERITAAERKK